MIPLPTPGIASTEHFLFFPFFSLYRAYCMDYYYFLATHNRG